MNLQSANFSVNWMSKKLHVTRSGYYAWLHRQENSSTRAKEEEPIDKAIDPIFAEHKERYGSLRIHQELRGSGFRISRKRVVRIMKKNGLHAKSRRHFQGESPFDPRNCSKSFGSEVLPDPS
jgi:hypothetical protein